MASSFDQLFPSLANPGNLGTAPYDPSSNDYSMGMPQSQTATNFLQQLNAATGNMQPQQAPQPDPNAYAPPAPDQNFMQGGPTQGQLPDEAAPGGNAPRKRLSLVDTIGRISDVLANVGGATPQYQPYLDQRVATAQNQRANDLDAAAKQADIRQTGTATQVAQNGILSQFAGGVKAAIASGADPHQAIASAAQAMGVPPNVAAMFGQQYDKNPGILDAFSAADPNKEIYGTTPQWYTGPDGKPVLVQVSNKGNTKIVNPGDGYAPADTIKTDNLGDTLQTRGAHSATPITSRVINGKMGTDETATAVDANGRPIRVAALPGSTGALNQQKTQAEIAKDQAQTDKLKNGSGAAVDPTAYRTAMNTLDTIQKGFDALHNMHALAGEDSASGGIGRTRLGQSIGAFYGTDAAQKRIELQKSLGALQSELIKSLPGSATRTRFEQEIQAKRLPDPMNMTYKTASDVIQQYRDAYNIALQSQGKPQAVPGQTLPRTIKAPAAAARGAGKPSVSNW